MQYPNPEDMTIGELIAVDIYHYIYHMTMLEIYVNGVGNLLDEMSNEREPFRIANIKAQIINLANPEYSSTEYS